MSIVAVRSILHVFAAQTFSSTISLVAVEAWFSIAWIPGGHIACSGEPGMGV